jgi:feruloyl-CoA hydratase/lyase
MTGLPFDGKKAAEMGLVNEAVPLADLRARTRALADILLEKNPMVLKSAKDAYKRVRDLHWESSEEYLVVKQNELNFLDKTSGRQQGMKQFLDEKTFKPGLGAYKK